MRLPALLALAFFAACRHPVPPIASAAASKELATDEEYEIYRAVLPPYLKGKTLFVVEDTTSSSSITTDLSRMFPDLGKDILEAYTAANERPANLEGARFQQPLPVALLTSTERKAIFGNKNHDGWESFYQRFPNSQGVMTLSRVGFDAARTTALVYVGNQSLSLAGVGIVYCLARSAGGWKIVAEQMAWIS